MHGGLLVPGEAGQRASSWIVRTNGDLELLAFEGVSYTTGRSAMKANLSTGFGILAGNPRASFNYDPITNVGAIALTEVARTGQQAAGQPVGTTYTSLDEPFINNSGHVAFMGSLNIGGDCVWFGTPGGLTLAACEGQSVDVVDPLSGPRVETVSSFLPLTGVPAPDGAGSGDGLPSPFSDTGQVVAKLSFTSTATHAIVISPPNPVDTDADTGFGRDLPVPELPAADTGFWYLLRPACDAGSWVSGGQGELAGRDAALP